MFASKLKKISPDSKPLPPPPRKSKPPAKAEPEEKLASNGGHGTDDALRVTQILEESNIPCCFVGISALIFYGAGRLRPDWELCVPTELVDKAAQVLKSEPYAADYSLVEPWPFPSSSLLHTYHRFKGRGTDFYFVLVPSWDAHMTCTPSNITRSLRGLPYPKLDVFIQSTLDMRNELQLCDAVDGANLTEQWGEEHLELDGTNDVEWAQEINRRGEEFADGNFAHWGPFVKDAPKSRREMWQAMVRTKKDRLDWTKPSDVYITQYRIVDDPDPWNVLSDMY